MYYDYHSPPRRRSSLFSYFLVALIAALIGGIIGGTLVMQYLETAPRPTPQGSKLQNTTLPPLPAAPGGDSEGAAGDITAIAERVTPAVVGIASVRVSYDFFFQPRYVQGIGTGVIVDERGYIVTNHHVVGKARDITVSLIDGRHVKGKTLWSDSDMDLAVVKINADGLTAAPLGDSSVLRVGELAVAIGNPLGLQFQRTVTSGIISALDRSVAITDENGQTTLMEGLVQTDASINPGNSGGPLLNSRGEVIGINTVKAASAEGIGFAIPVNLAKPIVRKVIATGRFAQPGFGVSLADRDVASYFELDLDLDRGIYVMDVGRGSAAAKSGLRRGDVILKINGTPVNSIAKLKEILFAMEIGDQVEVVFVRDGRENTTTVTLQEVVKQ